MRNKREKRGRNKRHSPTDGIIAADRVDQTKEKDLDKIGLHLDEEVEHSVVERMICVDCSRGKSKQRGSRSRTSRLFESVKKERRRLTERIVEGLREECHRAFEKISTIDEHLLSWGTFLDLLNTHSGAPCVAEIAEDMDCVSSDVERDTESGIEQKAHHRLDDDLSKRKTNLFSFSSRCQLPLSGSIDSSFDF